jgi:copper chaperone CopZ
MNNATTYRVPTVGSGHCSAAIIEEIARLRGVRSVEVDLRAKLVRVAGRDLNATAVVAAIHSAGYEAVVA